MDDSNTWATALVVVVSVTLQIFFMQRQVGLLKDHLEDFEQRQMIAVQKMDNTLDKAMQKMIEHLDRFTGQANERYVRIGLEKQEGKCLSHT